MNCAMCCKRRAEWRSRPSVPHGAIFVFCQRCMLKMTHIELDLVPLPEPVVNRQWRKG
jgi:hypothetical protein